MVEGRLDRRLLAEARDLTLDCRDQSHVVQRRRSQLTGQAQQLLVGDAGVTAGLFVERRLIVEEEERVDDCFQGIVDFMSDGSGHAAHRGKLLRAAKGRRP